MCKLMCKYVLLVSHLVPKVNLRPRNQKLDTNGRNGPAHQMPPNASDERVAGVMKVTIMRENK